MLVRVPEAYLLLRPFDATRPGLLVLDADARRIASIPLTGKPDSSAVADALTKALATEPRERLLLRVQEKATDETVKRLQTLVGAETPKALPGGFVEVWGTKGAVTPTHVDAIAAATKREIEVVDPVRVAVTATRDGIVPAKAIAGVAGVRHVTTAASATTAWISRWLLHPRHLEARGLRGDVAAVTFRFANLPDGPPAAKHFMRPFAEKGVLSVVPRVKDGAIELVVRPKVHDEKATLAALLGGGLSTLAGERDGHTVAFRHGEAGSKLAPRYSPKGFKVPLAPMEKGLEEGLDHREGRLRLGPKSTQGDGRLLVLARSVAGKAFDLLWVDTDGDGSVADEEVQRVASRISRGNVYTSYTSAVRVNHGTQEKPQWEPYRIGLWVAVEAESKAPEFIRFSRRGYLVGSVTLADAAYQIVLSDANHDGAFGAGDWWALLPDGADQANNIAAARKVGDFAWAGRKAYQLELAGTAGREGRVVPFDPGLTPEEDARKRDRYWDDKHAARAKTPLAFTHEIEDAIKQARSGGAHYFLDFETEWCGPCKLMDRWVYSAHDVVAAAQGVVCIKVDGDERKDLKELHKVAGFPTGILFDPQGKEVARFSGYQSVKDLTAFLGRAHAEK